MRIIYDYQVFSLQKYGGISRYFYEIITRLSLFKDFEVKVLAGLYINEYLKQCHSGLIWGMPKPSLPKITKISHLLNFQLSKFWLTIQNNQSKPAILHETYYSYDSIASKTCLKVLTVYDMVFEKFTNLFPSQAQEIISIKAKAIRRADHIICISYQTKKDLIELLGVEPKKITVVYLGYSFLKNIDSIECNFNVIKDPYIFYVGKRSTYKNFERLLKAYASRSNLKSNFKLICLGEQTFSRDELDKIHDLGLTENDVISVTGDDRILVQLYKQASAFVYPSLYEGFGIPPLEAMSLNCPVVCSNTSSIPEVVGEAAELFDPYDIDSIADALEKVLFSSQRRQTLIDLGKERVKNFSWEKCVKKTSLVYSSLH